ncbi:MAG: hypothetical protein ACPGN3_11750 [Opitutales bacterium]
MKYSLLVFFVFILTCMPFTSLEAAWPVVDYSQLQLKAFTSKRAILQEILQEGNQRVQILKMVEQIRQIDRQIELLGDPSKVNLRTLRRLYRLIEDIPISKTAEELEAVFHPDFLFAENAAFDPVSREIRIDGATVAQRDSALFIPEVKARQAFDHYDSVKSHSLDRRAELDSEIQDALDQLQTAQTDSEVQKLNGLIVTLNVRRAEMSDEIELAATEASSRFYRNRVESDIARKVRFQDERVRYRVGAQKHLESFPMLDSPVIFKP